MCSDYQIVVYQTLTLFMTIIIWIYFDFMAVELSKNFQYLAVIQHYCVFMTCNKLKGEKNLVCDWTVALWKSNGLP